jgi:hypothetical protein
MCVKIADTGQNVASDPLPVRNIFRIRLIFRNSALITKMKRGMLQGKEQRRADYLKRLQLVVRRPDGTEINYQQRLRQPSPVAGGAANSDIFEQAFEQHWAHTVAGKYETSDEEKLFQQFVYLFDAQIQDLLRSPDGLTRVWAQRYLQEFLARYCQSSRIRLMLPIDEDRRDCFADAFVVFIEKITRQEYEFRQKMALKSWFWKIYRDKCVDFLRKKTAKKNNREVPWADDDEEMMRKLSGQAIQKVQEAAQRRL